MTERVECNGLCKSSQSLYSVNCKKHGALALKDALKDIKGKRTSEGYTPKEGESVELRGD